MTDNRSAALMRDLRADLPVVRRLLDELQLKPLVISHSECFGIVEQWKDEPDGYIQYGRDLAEYIGAEGDETAEKFTELIVVTLNLLPSLLAMVDDLDEPRGAS